MNEPLIVYRVFNDPAFAEGFAEILKQRNIPFELEEDTNNLDASFGNHPLNRDYRIKLRQEDFIVADKALEDFFKSYAQSIEKDHYLYEFNDEELIEILAKRDEWGDINYYIAQKILKERGREITVDQLEKFKYKRLEELSKPEKTDYTSIILGYFVAFLISPAAIFLGYMLAYSKKTLPDGHRVPAYSERQKFHGRVILVIASIITAIGLLVTFL